MCEPTSIAALAIGTMTAGTTMVQQRRQKREMSRKEEEAEGRMRAFREYQSRRDAGDQKNPLQFRGEEDQRRRQRGLGMRRLTIPMGTGGTGTGVSIPE